MWSSIRVLAFLSTRVFKNVNATPTIVICLLSSLFLLLSLQFNGFITLLEMKFKKKKKKKNLKIIGTIQIWFFKDLILLNFYLALSSTSVMLDLNFSRIWICNQWVGSWVESNNIINQFWYMTTLSLFPSHVHCKHLL